MKSRKFIDHAVMYAEAGNGGNGSASFRREKFVPKGGPDGGDGGRGGDVVLLGDYDVDSLIAIHFAPHQRAEHAGPGRGKQRHGKNGAHRIVKVPRGTEVWVRETDEFLGEIIESGQEMVVARGGKGGLGNCHWKSSTHRAPREKTDGEPGEQFALRLELKIVADMGFVGYPNAGKSSLLTGISDAHPRIGAYPFTTLNPIIGTLIFEDYSRVTVADLPGLIDGAHDGVGLGHAFLRHIERASGLAFVIDMGATDGRKPEDDYQNLQEELRLFRSDIVDRPSIVVANKMDLPEAEQNLTEFKKATGIDALPVSALEEIGLDALRTAIHRLCIEREAS